MKFQFISLLLTSVRISAHLGHSHGEASQDESDTQHHAVSLLPVKTNRSTMDWTQDDQPFRLGHHKFKTLKDFKESGARCACPVPSESERIASQEDVEAYLQVHPELAAHNNPTRRRLQGAIDIPVYVHCITSGFSGECSSSMVDQQIAVLNAAFAPDFSFTLVSLEMYDRPEYYYCDVEDETQERSMKEELHQGDMGTLNVYTCDPADGVLGWATFPDGSYNGGAGDV
jgi:hypothetical protein